MSKKIRAIGIDAPSIKKFHVPDDTHQIFLEAGIPIFEGLCLKEAKANIPYFFVGLPLKVENADASPCRAILIEQPLPQTTA